MGNVNNQSSKLSTDDVVVSDFGDSEKGKEQQTQREVNPSKAAREKTVDLAADVQRDVKTEGQSERVKLAADLGAKGGVEGGTDLGVDLDTDTDTNMDMDSVADLGANKAKKSKESDEGNSSESIEKDKGKKEGEKLKDMELFSQIKVVFSGMAKGADWDNEKGVMGNFGKIDWGGFFKAASISTAMAWGRAWGGIKDGATGFWDKLSGLFKGDKKKKKLGLEGVKEGDEKIVSFSDDITGPPEKDRSRWAGLLGIPNALKLNITEDTAVFLDVLGAEAKKLGVEMPYITSAFRNHVDQARAMAGKWKGAVGRGGGDKEAGLRNFKQVYSPSTSAKFHAIFKKYGTDAEGQRRAAIASKETWPNPSSHRSGKCVDLRMTKGVASVLKAVKATGRVKFKELNEGDHYHISVKGSSAAGNAGALVG